MKKCNKCNLPETYETIEYDETQTCNICNQQDFKNFNINWKERKEDLDRLIEEYRGKYDYDCIVPFSGGKDSTFTLYYLMKEYKIKPLVIQFNHGFMRPNLLENNERTFKKLGVDFMSFTPNWNTVKRTMLETLIRKGDFCWHCHTGIFSYPMQIAIKFNVPLLFWGEPQSEYTAYYDYKDNEIEEVDEERFNKIINLGITAEDMEGMISRDHDLDPRDLLPYTYPAIRDLKKIGYKSVCLGSYIPWNTKHQSQIIKEELGWRGDAVEGMPPEIYDYEKIECYMQGSRDYIKFLKRGYSRVTQMTALDIRHGRMKNNEALHLIDEYEGKKPHSLMLLLEYLNISEEEFNNYIKKLIVPPYQPNFNAEYSKQTPDFKKWYRSKKND